jgi:hypothetical protein
MGLLSWQTTALVKATTVMNFTLQQPQRLSLVPQQTSTCKVRLFLHFCYLGHLQMTMAAHLLLATRLISGIL